MQGKEFFDKKLEEKFKYLKDFKTTPISRIKSITDIEDRQTFVYDYAPMMFIAIEKEIGAKKMWKWINNILNTKTDFTNYDFLLLTLKNAVNNEEKMIKIKEKFFQNENSTENILNILKNK